MTRTPLNDLEKGLAAKVSGASFPPGTASKRFARDLGSGCIGGLSANGRMFFAYVAHRFRRQYQLTHQEQAWVDFWLARGKERTNERANESRGRLAGSPRDGRSGGDQSSGDRRSEREPTLW